MKTPLLFPLLLLIVVAACSSEPKVAEVQSPLPTQDTTTATIALPIKKDCGLLLTAKEIGLPITDTFGIEGIEISRTQYLTLGLDSIEAFNNELRYEILGKMSSGKYTLLLFSATNSGRGTHWLVSYDQKNCNIIDKIETVHGESNKLLQEINSRILKNEIRITQRLSSDEPQNKTNKKEVKVIRISDEGKFVRSL